MRGRRLFFRSIIAAGCLGAVLGFAGQGQAVITCTSQALNGHHNCVFITDPGPGFYNTFQIKAADPPNNATPYSWVNQNGPSGSKGSGDYSWTAVVNANSGNWLLIDNQYCSCTTTGTYRVNLVTH